jgi:hypothetical protein
MAGDASSRLGEVAKASCAFSEAREQLCGLAAAGAKGWHSEMVKTATGLSFCLISSGDAERGVQVLDETIDRLGYSRRGAPLLPPWDLFSRMQFGASRPPPIEKAFVAFRAVL